MVVRFLLTIAVLCWFAGQTFAQISGIWPVSQGGNGNRYEVIVSSNSWTQAKSAAEQRGGHLASISSAAELEFVRALIAATGLHAAWIGLVQTPGASEPAGGWGWVTAEPFSFAAWSTDEPNNNGAEHFGQMYSSNGTWNDVHDTYPGPAYVVEYEYSGNRALKLDGNADAALLQKALTDMPEFTVEAWVKSSNQYAEVPVDQNNNSLGVVFSDSTIASAHDLSMSVSDTMLYTRCDKVDSAPRVSTPFASVSDGSGQWRHVAWVFSNAGNVVYVNGCEVFRSVSTGGNVGYHNDRPAIGCFKDAAGTAYASGDLHGYFSGMIDELRIWSRPRTQAEIASERSHPLSGKEAGLEAYWNFDFDASSAADLTGHGYTASLFGNAAIQSQPFPGPSVTTLPASSLGLTNATLNGMINPQGFQSTVYFEYGPTALYGSSTGPTDVPAEGGDVAVAIEVQGLARTAYHYRIVAISSAGPAYGNDQVLSLPNQAPVAAGDSIHAEGPPLQDGAMILRVMANDTDPDGDVFRVTAVTQGTNGTVAIFDRTMLAYTPGPGFTGNDTFTYTITDSLGTSATATVNITNTAPIAVNDAFHPGDIPGPQTYYVLENDSDADPSDHVFIAQVTDGAFGKVSTDRLSVQYTPGTGYTGNDSFTYTITDDRGGTSTATVTITNTAPVAVNDAFHPGDIPGPQTYSVLGNDSDADPSDGISIAQVTDGAFGKVSTDRLWVQYTPGPGYTGNDSFTYTITDGRGGTSTATVTLSNLAPTANNDVFTAPRAPVMLNVLANDTDPNSDHLSIASVTQGAAGSVVTDHATVIYTPGADFKNEDSFTYSVTDGRGGAATARVTVILSAPVSDLKGAKGSDAPGGGGAVFRTFGTPSINRRGDLAFLGTMKDSDGRIKSAVFEGSRLKVIARQGQLLPAIPGATFSGLKDPVLDSEGRVAFIGTMAGVPKNTDTAIWLQTADGLKLVAREGVEAAGAPGAIFSSFLSIALPDTGRAAFVATLVKGVGGITSSKDLGVWVMARAGGLRLVIREGDRIMLGVTERTVKTVSLFAAPGGSPGQRRGFNSTGDLLLRLGFTDGMEALVCAKDDGALEEVVDEGATLPDLDGAQFDAFSLGGLNDNNSTAFRATLKHVRGSVSSVNDAAIVANAAGSDLQLVARTGSAVPGMPGAVFRTLQDPVSGADGTVAFVATLKPGFGAVSAKNDSAIWIWRGGAPAVFVREGDNAPEVKGGRFAAFSSLSIPGSRGLAFVATLVRGGGITARNDAGLWAQDREGVLRLLVREGQTFEVNGAAKKLSAFTVLSAVATSPAQGHSYTGNGGFAYRATFTDGSQAVYTVWLP